MNRNRRASAPRRRNASWRERDTRIAAGRLAIAVAAILALGGLGMAGRPDYGPPKAPHGPYEYRPATDVERLTHELDQAFEMDKLTSPSPNPGWGAD